MKKCSRCKVPKRDGEFHKNRKSLDGMASHCKECHSRANYGGTIHRAAERIEVLGKLEDERLRLEASGNFAGLVELAERCRAMRMPAKARELELVAGVCR